MSHPTYKQPSYDPVNPLIEFNMSVDGHHMYNNENLGIHTVDQVQSNLGLVHQGWSRTKSPIEEEGNDHH
jgi:hypothetical protein